MKKFLKLIPIFVLIFSLSSCVDYVQSISYKNGKYQMYYKVSFSKSLFAMMDEDPEEIFNNFDEEAIGEVPKNASVNRVNTDFEVGLEFKFSIDSKTSNENEKSFLPTMSGNKFYIPFLLGQNDSIADSLETDNDDYGAAFANAVMSSAKCRILISKSIISSIKTAYFEGKGSQNYSIPVFDYGDATCLEIPFIVLLQEDMYRTDRVVVIK